MVDSLHGDFGLPCSALDALKSVFRQYPYVEGLIIYGSRAKGNYRLGSDIDLCIEGPLLSTTDLLADSKVKCNRVAKVMGPKN